jgi:uracil-DNA glycosylase
MHGANRTGRPFTGDHAGILLYRTLHETGFATRAESTGPGDGLRLLDCRISNAVKCLPPANKPGVDEVRRCNRYLAREIHALAAGAVIVALGRIAHGAILAALWLKPGACPFAHGSEHRLQVGHTLLDSYHCSRLNTNTGRLTPVMFRRIFERARHLIAG